MRLSLVHMLLLALLIGGCVSSPRSANPLLKAAEEDSVFYPEVSPEVKNAFDGVPRFEAKDVYQEYDGLKVAQFVVYSSGQVETLTVSGQQVLALWVYDLTRMGVVQYPLVLAILSDDGRCEPLYRPDYDPLPEWQDCQVYQRALEPWIKRGKLLYPAVAGNFVYPDHIEWEKCPEAHCRLAQALEEAYHPYNLDRLVLQRYMRRAPKGWALSWTWGSGEEILSTLEVQKQ